MMILWFSKNTLNAETIVVSIDINCSVTKYFADVAT